MDPSPATLDIHTQKPAAKTGAENSQGMDHPQQPSRSPMPEPQNDPEFWPLSGKPYFYVVLKEPSDLAKMKIPRKLSEKFPAASGPAKIICRGKVWDLHYQGATKSRFEDQTWKQFVRDNSLAVGDACVFELVESSSHDDDVRFKVQILKGDFPSELLENAEGLNMNNPISID